MLVLIEFCLTVSLIVLALAVPSLDSLFQALGRRVSSVASKRGIAVCIVFIIALSARLVVLPIEHIPVPGVDDEFSYLLMGDTFAHGRLSNPTHPTWMHFETRHTNQKPTYCSMYYPAQGVFLAAGQIMFRHPFWGVWLSTALMCAAFCWALQGWMPSLWAFLGGILAVVRLDIFSYWDNSYWGGSVAALGGALVLGALPRIARHKHVINALIMGLGLAILANSRPYESVFYSFPVFLILGYRMVKKRGAELRRSLLRVVLPLSVIGALTLAAMGYYYWRTTGNPVRPPYMLNYASYRVAPPFPWQKPYPIPHYRNAQMRDFYLGWDMDMYRQSRAHPVLSLTARVAWLLVFFIGPPLLVLLAFLCLSGPVLQRCSRKTHLLALIVGIALVGNFLPYYFDPHYAAPVTCALLALAIQAVRHLRAARRGQGCRRIAIRAGLVACVLAAPVTALALAAGASPSLLLDGPYRANADRARILQSLQDREGKFLIIVRYRPDHQSQDEWVYNDADIDASKVVWARELSPPENKNLIDYFEGRTILLLEADTKPPTFGPYPVDQLQAAGGAGN